MAISAADRAANARVNFGKAVAKKLEGGVTSQELTELRGLADKLLTEVSEGRVSLTAQPTREVVGTYSGPGGFPLRRYGYKNPDDQLAAELKGSFVWLLNGGMAAQENGYLAALNGETLKPVREILVNALRDGKLEPVEVGMLNKAMQTVHRDLVKAGKISEAKDLENEGPFELDRLRMTFQEGAQSSGGWAFKANALRDNRVAMTGEDKRTVAALQYLNAVEAKQALGKACPGVKLETFEIEKGETQLRISYQSPLNGFVPAYQVENALKGLLKKARLDEGVDMFVFPAPNKREKRKMGVEPSNGPAEK